MILKLKIVKSRYKMDKCIKNSNLSIEFQNKAWHLTERIILLNDLSMSIQEGKIA